jgi:hypothetical protein
MIIEVILQSYPKYWFIYPEIGISQQVSVKIQGIYGYSLRVNSQSHQRFFCELNKN